MTVEEKAAKAAAMAKAELNHPLFMAAPGAKKAILAMAEAVEALAHEVEVLRFRADRLPPALALLVDINDEIERDSYLEALMGEYEVFRRAKSLVEQAKRGIDG